jgi:anti-sigma regulatory factor (Ser/Thr protein kinase)
VEEEDRAQPTEPGASQEESRNVSLTVPAKPDYLVLARLALSAVCRLTLLEALEVADLKLAVTEAASEFVHDGDDRDDETIAFDFRLSDDRLVLELVGPQDVKSSFDRELSHAIIDATVDGAEFMPGRTRLVKQLP